MLESNERNDEFAGSMRTAMHNSVEDVTATPALLPALRKRYARRVTARRVGVVAAPLAVAAVVVGSVAIAPNFGSSQPAQAAGTASQTTGTASLATGTASLATGTAAQVQDIAYVTAQVNKALDNADHDVVYFKQTFTVRGQSQVLEFWVSADGSAVRKREAIDGKVVIDSETAKTPSIDVNYADQTWTRSPGSNGQIAEAFPRPQEIKQALDSGALKIVGAGELINGQSTIHLHREGLMRGYTGAVFDDLWVNESSYLPIRIGYPPLRVNNTTYAGASQHDLTWLPPTAENLALLTPPIPAGFREVPENQTPPPSSVPMVPGKAYPNTPLPGK